MWPPGVWVPLVPIPPTAARRHAEWAHANSGAQQGERPLPSDLLARPILVLLPTSPEVKWQAACTEALHQHSTALAMALAQGPEATARMLQVACTSNPSLAEAIDHALFGGWQAGGACSEHACSSAAGWHPYAAVGSAIEVGADEPHQQGSPTAGPSSPQGSRSEVVPLDVPLAASLEHSFCEPGMGTYGIEQGPVAGAGSSMDLGDYLWQGVGLNPISGRGPGPNPGRGGAHAQPADAGSGATAAAVQAAGLQQVVAVADADTCGSGGALPLFDVLRQLPADIVWSQLLLRVPRRDWKALSLTCREFNTQMCEVWCRNLSMGLTERFLEHLQQPHRETSHQDSAAGGSAGGSSASDQSLPAAAAHQGPGDAAALWEEALPAADEQGAGHQQPQQRPDGPAAALSLLPAYMRRFRAATSLCIRTHRLQRVLYPTPGRRSLPGMDMPPLTVDITPPLTSVIEAALGPPIGHQLTRLVLDCANGSEITEDDLHLVSAMAPELQELWLISDVCQRPAALLGPAVSGLARLQRLRIDLQSSAYHYDPRAEDMVHSLGVLTQLQALSLRVSASELLLPAAQLAGLTALQLCITLTGYGPDKYQEQLVPLVAALGQLTRLQYLSMPHDYRKIDVDLLLEGSGLLCTLVRLEMPRLCVRGPELQALERLGCLESVVLGSMGALTRGSLSGLTSWRSLRLVEEQSLEFLVGALPLPPRLERVWLESVSWPRDARADSLDASGARLLEELCGALAAVSQVALCLEALRPMMPGDHATPHPDALVATVEALAAALGSVQGLAVLRWRGLLQLLACVPEPAMQRALASLAHVRQLHLDGNAGISSSYSCLDMHPLFLHAFGVALAGMRSLRTLRLRPTDPRDALVQGLAGLLVSVRRPLAVEASCLDLGSAARLRAHVQALLPEGRRCEVVPWDEAMESLVDESDSMDETQRLFRDAVPTAC